MKTRTRGAIAGALATAFSVSCWAGLITAYQFNGHGNWSIDAVGSNNTPTGLLQAVVPVGATVERAYLYSSVFNTAGAIGSILPTVDFDGTTYSGAAWTDLGGYNPNPLAYPNFYLQAFRADVTAQVAAKTAGGHADPFGFLVSESLTANLDGEVLALVYSLPSEELRTIAFLDGHSTSGGDSTTVAFAAPLTAEQLMDPAFSAIMSLGVGYGAGGSQYSTIDVNSVGNRLTSSAGGYNDGSGVNGALITAGGLGDSTTNPLDPLSTNSPDDELYDLFAFLAPGQTQLTLLTDNPSLDDNIFFAGLNLTVSADVIPNGVPDDGLTGLLLVLGLAPLAAIRRHRARTNA